MKPFNYAALDNLKKKVPFIQFDRWWTKILLLGIASIIARTT